MSAVLVVEDDVTLRGQLVRMLQKIPGVELVEAGTLQESIDLADAMSLDLVITDLRLPDGDALHLFPHLERSGRRTPTIVISGELRAFSNRLPPDVAVFEKPVRLTTLHEAAVQGLGRPRAHSPFSLAEYLQLAAFGRHSIQLEVSRFGELLGIVVIRDGEPWTAHDAEGSGMEAFLRMMAVEVTVDVAAPPSVHEPRTLHSSSEHLLLEAARATDERGGKKKRMPTDPPATSRTPTWPLVAPLRSPAPIAAKAEPSREFDRLYGEGIDALLLKRYGEAFDLFCRAKTIKSTPTLDANLNRLRILGYT